MPPSKKSPKKNVERQKRPYRTGTITLEQAIKKFNEYYNTDRSKIGSIRAKKFDKMYQKKKKFQIKCNNTKNMVDNIPPGHCEKGSVKYLLKHGPKTFDIQGVDSFNEGITINNEDNTQTRSRGATIKKTVDNDLENDKIYGPRVDNGELYSEYFRREYQDDTGNKKALRDDKSNLDASLVNNYWNK